MNDQQEPDTAAATASNPQRMPPRPVADEPANTSSRTPWTLKTSSTLRTEKSEQETETLANIHDIMEDEMKGAIIANADEIVDNFLSTSHIRLGGPSSLDDVLKHLTTKGLYSDTEKKWADFPSSSGKDCEKNLAMYFEKVADAASDLFQSGLPRKHWTAEHATRPVTDKYCDRKPDLAIVTSDAPPAGPERTWWHILGTLEVKPDKNDFDEALGQLIESARLIYSVQPHRRFLLDAILCGEFMTLVLFDRSGALFTQPFNVHEQPKRFLQVAVGLLHLNDANRGFDPTVNFTDPTSGTVIVEGVKHSFDNVIYIEGVVRGRGTACYPIVKDGVPHLVKDSWVDERRENKEGDIVNDLHSQTEEENVKKHIPKILADENVLFEGKPDSTALVRSFISRRSQDGKHHEWTDPSMAKVEIREHRRMLMTPVARNLEDFSCLAELLTAFIHTAESTPYCFFKRSNTHILFSHLRNVQPEDDAP